MRKRLRPDSAIVMSYDVCSCGQRMVPKPVPGAVAFPRRLECPEYGAPQERHSGLNAAPKQDWRDDLKESMSAFYVNQSER